MDASDDLDRLAAELAVGTPAPSASGAGLVDRAEAAVRVNPPEDFDSALLSSRGD